MATFYIQLENKLLQISGDLTTENISKTLGYVPVSPNVTNELSQRVDNITFDSLKDNPFLQDGSGELNIVDESGNIIAKIDADGIHSVDFIAGEHRLSDKTDKIYVDEAVKNVKVDLTGYATEEYVNNIDFYNIKDNPIVNNGDGKLLFVDENGYIGLQLEEDGLYVKDVIADGHTLSQKADKSELPTKISELQDDKGFLTEHQDISHLASKDEVYDSISNIDFYTIKDNPVLNTENGKLLFVDESGNIGLQLENDKLYVSDVVAGDHILSNKADKDDIPSLEGYAKTSDIPSLDGYAKTEDIPSLDGLVKTEDLPNFDEFAKTEDIPEIPSLDDYASKEWVNNKNYATEYELKTIDYSSINNVPVSEDETGELNITDESGNIGMKVASEAVYAKDFVAGEHKLSEKVDKTYVDNSIAEIKNNSSDANIQAVDTGDVIDDVNVDYATTAYVDGLIGDINSVLESIINGGGYGESKPINYGHIQSTNGNTYTLQFDLPVASDLEVDCGDANYVVFTGKNTGRSYTMGPGESIGNTATVSPDEDATYIYKIIIE